MSDTNNVPVQPPQNLLVSPRARAIAEMIDRLPPGTYELTVLKPDVAAASWQVEVVRQEPIRTLTLPKIQTSGESGY